MLLPQAIEGSGFTALAEGYSSLTLNAYKSAIQLMIEYLGDLEIEEVTTDHLKSFMNYLVTNYVPEGINNPNNREKLSTASHHRY